jgi:hypothetical protein
LVYSPVMKRIFLLQCLCHRLAQPPTGPKPWPRICYIPISPFRSGKRLAGASGAIICGFTSF